MKFGRDLGNKMYQQLESHIRPPHYALTWLSLINYDSALRITTGKNCTRFPFTAKVKKFLFATDDKIEPASYSLNASSSSSLS